MTDLGWRINKRKKIKRTEVWSYKSIAIVWPV